MFAVILAEDDAFFRTVAHRSRLHKYSVARYRDPVKLADNLPELRPELLVIRGTDYPLHWEILASQLFCSRSPAESRILLFLPENHAIPFNWPNVSVVSEKAEPSSTSALSDEAAKEFSALLSPQRAGKLNQAGGHTKESKPGILSEHSSSLIRAAGRSTGR